MNEQGMADAIALIIDNKIAKAVEPLNLQIAAQKTIISGLSETIEVVKEFGLDNSGTLSEYKSNYAKTDEAVKTVTEEFKQSQTEVKELVDAAVKEQNEVLGEVLKEQSTALADFDEFQNELSEVKTLITLNTEALKKEVVELITTNNTVTSGVINNEHKNIRDDLFKIHKTQADIINNEFEIKTLELHNKVTNELLRLNTHVDSKLVSLKGEKGDAGEKGEQGESGFLSGVSKWETGSITKHQEAVIHNNALWSCNVEQSAKEPAIGDDWTLVVDGVSSIEMVDNNIQIKYSSGKIQDVGRVGFVHKGQYDSKKKYMKGDIVTVNKTSFVSMEDDNANNPPSNNWKLLSGKGDKGAKGDSGGNIEAKELTTLIIDVVEGMK